MLEFPHVNDSPSKAVSTLRSRIAPAAGVAFLLLLIGLGGYIIVKHLMAWHHYREAVRDADANQLADARCHLDECLKVWKKDTDVHFLAGRVCRRLRAFDDAERHLEICKQYSFDAEKIQLERAMLQAQRDSPADVEGYLMALVLKDHPDSSLILEALIQGYLKTYQLPQAHHCANLWVQRTADSSQAHFWRGMVWEKVLNNKAAAEDFRAVVATEPENFEARLHYADLLLGFKEYAEALEHYEWLAGREPNNLQVLLGLAGCRVGLSQVEQADELLEQLLGNFPDNPLVLAECGKLGMKMGKSADAESWLRRSVSIDPYEPEAVFALSQVLQQRGKTDEASKWREKHDRIVADLTRLYELNKEIIAAPRDPKLRHEIGVIFLRNGREKEGLSWLGTALQMDPHHRPTHRTLAEFCEKNGMAREAEYHRQQGK
jgi:tetratricopeptide (TPR) repeat protein